MLASIRLAFEISDVVPLFVADALVDVMEVTNLLSGNSDLLDIINEVAVVRPLSLLEENNVDLELAFASIALALEE